MLTRSFAAKAVAIILSLSASPTYAMPSDAEMMECAPKVPIDVLKKIVGHESSGNPLALGLNSNLLQLKSQPKNKQEAEELIRVLDAAGLSYDVGVGQVNNKNLSRWGVDPKTALDVCQNLEYAQKVYVDCADRYGSVTEILSCYNTNDPFKGVKNGYVSKVLGGGHARNIKKAKTVDQVKKPVSLSHAAQEAGLIDDSDEWIKDDGWLQ
jgi:hypothetical protein